MLITPLIPVLGRKTKKKSSNNSRKLAPNIRRPQAILPLHVYLRVQALPPIVPSPSFPAQGRAVPATVATCEVNFKVVASRPSSPPRRQRRGRDVYSSCGRRGWRGDLAGRGIVELDGGTRDLCGGATQGACARGGSATRVREGGAWPRSRRRSRAPSRPPGRLLVAPVIRQEPAVPPLLEAWDPSVDWKEEGERRK
jgi:hypothetical protein